MKSTTPRAKGVVIREREQGVSQRIVIHHKMTKDKGKAKMIEPEKPLKIAVEEAQRVEEANLVLIKEWNNVQAKIDADYELAQRLQQQEQEELIDAEKAKLFVQLLEARKKHFAAKRAEEQKVV
ncbi:hypothetical protein Tco_1022488 [Tanacetum coccineum]